MASDLDHAEFLKAKFAHSFDLIKSQLSPENEIKDLFESIIVELGKRNFRSPESISLLYDLNDTVTNYQLYLSEQNQDDIVKKTFTQCLPTISQTRFSWDFKSQLSKIKSINDPIPPATTSPPPLPAPTGKDASFEIHGFEEQEKDIVDLLSAPAAFKAIGIYGMCGTGKTTLVQKVLKNERVRADFPLVIWRSMSDICLKDLNIPIVKDILSNDLKEDVDRMREGGDVSFVLELHRKLLESNKKYLIVLDDLWYCNDWFSLNDYLNEKVETEAEKRNVSCFFNALPRDGAGGAVIVTSRLKEVAENMVMTRRSREEAESRWREEAEKTVTRSRSKEEAEKMVARNLYHLKPLDSEDESANECLRAIVKEGLHPKGQEDEELLREIVRRCHGLPLAARILGNKVKDVLIEMEKEEEKRRKKEEEERKKKEEEERRKEEERKKEEERRKEERRKKEDEERKKKEEEERLKKEEEERKKEEPHKKEEEERIKAELREKEEELRKKEEEQLRKEEEERKNEELRKKEEEEREEELRKKEEEELRKKEEVERKKEELHKKEEEELRKKEEEERKKEELRKKEEEEEEERQKEELHKKEEEELRKKEEEELRKKEEEERKEELRKKEEEEEGKKEELRKKEEEESKKE